MNTHRRSFLKALMLGAALAFPAVRIVLKDNPLSPRTRIQELMAEMLSNAVPVEIASYRTLPTPTGSIVTFKRPIPNYYEITV